MGKVIGIDLGTTNSVVALIEGGVPTVIANAEGSRTTPSVVAFSPSGERLVGQVAKRQAVTNAANTVYAVKRLIGRKFESPEARRFAEHTTFLVEPDSEGDAKVVVLGRPYDPAEISALVLEQMKCTAEAAIGESLQDAVVTVPAYFDDSQRQATKNAGRIAGLNVVRIINEPTAAALAYGLDRKEEGTIGVFDLGGGTFDVSILRIGKGVFEVKATNGDTFLGGEDFDLRILESLAADFEREYGIDLRRDKAALQRLKEASERAKQELSSLSEVDVHLPFITADGEGNSKHLRARLTRARLEELVADLIERLDLPCRRALSDAGLRPEDIEEVLLVGGMTRMPRVQEKVREIFGREPNHGVNPEEVVAVGAAIQGSVLAGDVKDVLLLDVAPLSLGIETHGGVFTRLIDRNTTVPTRRKQIFTTAEDDQDYVFMRIFQGERDIAADNRLLGALELTEIRPSPRGVPQVEVAFDIDANGILHVSARDLDTGREQSVRITAATGLTDEEIERLTQEAKNHAERDRARRDLVVARNDLEGYVYQAERSLQDLGDHLASPDRHLLEGALEAARSALEGEDIQAIRGARETLLQVSQKALAGLSAAPAEEAGGEPEA